MSRMILSVIAGLLSVILLASCASSKRMARMSGGMFGDSFLPEYEYIDESCQKLPSKMIERKKYEITAGIDDSIINIWPFFYRNRNYFSFVWPLIDYDRFGFAVRPFFNKEGNEYSVLFPLSGWNSARKNGWILNFYWSEKGLGSIPLFYIPWNSSERFFYILLLWQNKENYGFFPLVWGKNGENGYFNLVPVLFHNRERSMVPLLFYYSAAFQQFLLYYHHKDGDYGFFPLFHRSGNLINFIFPVYWNSHHIFGTILPYTYFNSKSGDWIIAPFWKLKDSFGMFPVFFQKSDGTDGMFFPLYYYDSKLVLTLLGGWGKKEDGSSFMTVLGPLYIQNKGNFESNRTYFYTGCRDFAERLIRKSHTFRMYGLFGYSNFGVGLRFQDNHVRDLYTSLNTVNEKTKIFQNQSTLDQQLKKVKQRNPRLSCLPDSVPQDKEKRAEIIRKLEKEAEEIELKKYGVFPLFQLEQNRPVKSVGKEFFSFDLGPFGILNHYFCNNNLFRFSVLGPFGYNYEKGKNRKKWRLLLLFSLEKSESGNSFWSPLFSFSEKWREMDKWRERQLFGKYKNWESETVCSFLGGLLYRERKRFYPSFRDYSVTREYLNRPVRFSNPLIGLYDTVQNEDSRINKDKITFDEQLKRIIFLLFEYDRQSSLKEDWHLAWLLARGSRDGDRSQLRILEWIYRSNKEGDRENTLIFPFISIQKENNRESCSFLWRLFRLEYRNGKLTGGNLFFIPF